jgi:hypothetical protein
VVVASMEYFSSGEDPSTPRLHIDYNHTLIGFPQIMTHIGGFGGVGATPSSLARSCRTHSLLHGLPRRRPNRKTAPFDLISTITAVQTVSQGNCSNWRPCVSALVPPSAVRWLELRQPQRGASPSTPPSNPPQYEKNLTNLTFRGEILESEVSDVSRGADSLAGPPTWSPTANGSQYLQSISNGRIAKDTQ